MTQEIQQEEKINISKNRIVDRIYKQHITKLILQISTGIMYILFLLIAILTLTPFSNGLLIEQAGETYTKVWIEYAQVWDYIPIIMPTDLNALYVFNGVNNNIVILLTLVGGSGWLILLTYITIQKNMITPQAIKKTVRKGLQFDYLRQADVEYISREIDYNTNKRERPGENETNLIED